LIVGTQRTGSSALGEAIGVHPEIICGWEWTQHAPWSRKIAIAERALNGDFSLLGQNDREHMAAVFGENKTWLGFRRLFRSSDKWLLHPRFSPALWLDRLETHLNWLASRPDIHIIHIVRNDNLEWLKSKFLSHASQVYWGKGYPEGLKVTIPVREAIGRLRSKDWVDARLSSLAKSNPYLRINYEDFLEDNRKVTASALHFLHCSADSLPIRETQLKPQSKGSAVDYIMNHEELIGTLRELQLIAPVAINQSHPDPRSI